MKGWVQFFFTRIYIIPEIGDVGCGKMSRRRLNNQVSPLQHRITNISLFYTGTVLNLRIRKSFYFLIVGTSNGISTDILTYGRASLQGIPIACPFLSG